MRTSIALGAIIALAATAGAVYALSSESSADEPDAVGAASTRTEAGADRPRRSGRRGGPRTRDAQAEDTGQPKSLEARVAKLEREMATLRRQLAVSRGMASSASARDDGTTPVDSPEFDSSVRDIVTDERQRERTARWERRSERAMQELAKAGGLSDDQQTAVAALWDTEREQITPLFVAARSGERDMSEVRDEVEGIIAETDAEAAKVLSEAQLEAYGEARPRGPRGRGRQ